MQGYRASQRLELEQCIKAGNEFFRAGGGLKQVKEEMVTGEISMPQKCARCTVSYGVQKATTGITVVLSAPRLGRNKVLALAYSADPVVLRGFSAPPGDICAPVSLVSGDLCFSHSRVK